MREYRCTSAPGKTGFQNVYQMGDIFFVKHLNIGLKHPKNTSKVRIQEYVAKISRQTLTELKSTVAGWENAQNIFLFQKELRVINVE